MDSQGEMNPVQHENGLEVRTDQVFYSIFEFPGKGDNNELD